MSRSTNRAALASDRGPWKASLVRLVGRSLSVMGRDRSPSAAAWPTNLRLDKRAEDHKVSTAVRDNEVIERIDAFCDAVPRRRTRAIRCGPLVLFVPVGPGWPYYARPRRGSRPLVTATDVRAVRARQRELIIPESFEWIEQVAPEMAASASPH